MNMNACNDHLISVGVQRCARGWRFLIVSWFLTVPGRISLIIPVFNSLPLGYRYIRRWLAWPREKAAAKAPVASQLGALV